LNRAGVDHDRVLELLPASRGWDAAPARGSPRWTERRGAPRHWPGHRRQCGPSRGRGGAGVV